MSSSPHRHRADRSGGGWKIGAAVGAAAAVVLVGVSPFAFAAGNPEAAAHASAPRPTVIRADAARVEARSSAAVPKPETAGAARVTEVAAPVDLTHMTAAQLQAKSAQMQAKYIASTAAYRQAQQVAAQQAALAKAAADDAARAKAAEADGHRALAAMVDQSFADPFSSHPLLSMMASPPQHAREAINGLTLVQNVTQQQAATVQQLHGLMVAADAAAARAADARRAAVTATTKAKDLLAQTQSEAAQVASVANAALMKATAAADAADKAQTDRNTAAYQRWRGYLRSLARAHVVPPHAAALTGHRMPFGLRPLYAAGHRPVPGVAATTFHGHPLTVLPQETIAAVSRAFSALNKPYQSGTSGPKTYDCSGLAQAMFARVGYRLPGDPASQYARLAQVPTASRQVGDLVFFTDQAGAVTNVGLYLGQDQILTSDPTSNVVGVQDFPSTAYAVARVDLPDPRHARRLPTPTGVAAASSRAGDTRCGGAPVLPQPPVARGLLTGPVAKVAGAVLTYPVRPGTYTLGMPFGVAGPMWSSGYHTGQDFVCPTGTPVLAAGDGIAHVTPTSWGGPYMVTIDHGNGLETVYAHVSKDLFKDGQQVHAGQVIALSGAYGNVTGPHLHFEVHVNGVAVDPMPYLKGTGSATATGAKGSSSVPATASAAGSATDSSTTAHARRRAGKHHTATGKGTVKRRTAQPRAR